MTDLIAQHVAHLRSAGKARTTIDSREELLHRLDRELPMGLCHAYTEELEEWLAGPAVATDNPWSRQTQATYYSHIVGFYRWASDPDRTVGMDYDPSASLVRPRVPARAPRPVRTDQLVRARAKLPHPYRLYVELAAFAGLRAVEVSRLDRQDVTKEELLIRRGKGDKARTVPVSPELWRAVQPLPRGPIARTVRGDRATSRQVYARTNRQLDRIGLEGVTLHQFRHWFATYLLDEEVEVTAVQKAMGHGSLNTTAGYLALTSKQRAKLSRAVRALPALVSAPC